MKCMIVHNTINRLNSLHNNTQKKIESHSLRAHFLTLFPASELIRWFDPLTCSIQGDKCIILFPHKLFADWFFATSAHKLLKGFSTLPEIKKIQYALGTADNIIDEQSSHAIPFVTELSTSSRLTLNEEQIFENFLTNKKNERQVQAAYNAVKTYPGIPYSPIVIIGPSGTGKTHLLNAMANSLHKKNIGLFHGKAQQLTAMQIDELSLFQTPSFFIDDLQSIKDSKEQQRKFLYFFDHAKAQNLFIVICIDAHPSNYTGLSNKVRMRLTDGLLLELKKPDLGIRLKYTQHHAEKQGLAITKETTLSLAQRHSDFRAINGALLTLQAYKDIAQISDTDMRQLLGTESLQKILSPKEIIKQVAKFYNISSLDIIGKKRNKNISQARHMAVFLCRELTTCTLAQIGEFFGGRDHSSIVYTINKVQSLQRSNQDTNNQITQLKKMCLNGPLG